jgi:hypothetical protein
MALTRAAALARALEAFDRATTDRARANLTGLLLDGVDADQIDDFREMEREMVAQARAEYAAHVAAMLDALTATLARTDAATKAAEASRDVALRVAADPWRRRG